jgi:hypothetical protein
MASNFVAEQQRPYRAVAFPTSAAGSDLVSPADVGVVNDQTAVDGISYSPQHSIRTSASVQRDINSGNMPLHRGPSGKADRRNKQQDEQRQMLLARGAVADIPDDSRITLLFDLNGKGGPPARTTKAYQPLRVKPAADGSFYLCLA